MALRTNIYVMLLGLAALVPAASGCGARSDLAPFGSESTWRCADGSRGGAIGCTRVAFADAVTYPTGGTHNYYLLLADLNSDGALDLVVPGGETDTVMVLFNQGDGTFSDGGPYATSLPCTSGASAGDLNQDGAIDLVIGTCLDALNNDPDSKVVSVLLGDGHGAFAPGVRYAAGLSPNAIALGDVDGDNLPDIATANVRGDNISILSNLGDGTFAPPVSYGPVRLPTSIAMGDLNHDGRLDLAVTSGEVSGVSVLRNAGGGTFASPMSYPDSGAFYSDMVIADVNGDGSPDLVYGPGVHVGVRMNAGDGTFGVATNYPATYPEPSGGASDPAVADLNGDCRLDIAAVTMEKDTVGMLPNLGDGDFGSMDAHATAHGPVTLAAGDLNGDGKADLVVAYWDFGGVDVLINQGCAP